MKTRIILLTALLTMLFAGCAKAQTAWITDLDTAQSEAGKTKKDLLIVFTGSDWNDPSKELIAKVFTEEFFKQGSKNFVLCNIDIVQDEKLMDKALIDTNYKVATKYNIQALPSIVLQTSEGDVYASSGETEATKTTEGFFTFLDTFKEARKKLVDLKQLIKTTKGVEKAANIDLFIEALDPSRREQYAALIREVPVLDGDGKAGLRGKYQLQVAYLDAVTLYQAGSLTQAGDLFIKTAEGGTLDAPQTQEAWYMAAYMYAMSESVDNDKIIGMLEKAIAADPGNAGTGQIKATIDQIKAAPPKQKAAPEPADKEGAPSSSPSK